MEISKTNIGLAMVPTMAGYGIRTLTQWLCTIRNQKVYSHYMDPIKDRIEPIKEKYSSISNEIEKIFEKKGTTKEEMIQALSDLRMNSMDKAFIQDTVDLISFIEAQGEVPQEKYRYLPELAGMVTSIASTVAIVSNKGNQKLFCNLAGDCNIGRYHFQLRI